MADFNVSPYYDDFLVAGSDGKKPQEKYYRILFRPSVAIQAREMTQLQTTLQQQITNFGDHVFEEGAMVLPGGTALDLEYGFIKSLQGRISFRFFYYLNKPLGKVFGIFTAHLFHDLCQLCLKDRDGMVSTFFTHS